MFGEKQTVKYNNNDSFLSNPVTFTDFIVKLLLKSIL